MQSGAATTRTADAAVACKHSPANSCMMMSETPLPTLALGRIAKLSLYRALEQREAHDFLDIPTTKRQRARDRGGAHAGARARGAHAIVAERAARGRDWAAAGARARSAPMPSAPSA